jgi:hypothetical protein
LNSPGCFSQFGKNALELTAFQLRTRTRIRTRVFAAVFSVFVTLPAAYGDSIDPATQAAAKAAEAKFDILGSTDAPHTGNLPAVVITELEINSYMKVHSGESLPKGVHTPSLSIQPEHAILAGDINFDELSRSYPNPNDMGPKILAAMFKGTQRVTIVGKVQSENAGYRVEIQSVTVGSIAVPKWLVDYLIQNVVQPQYKLDLTKPLPYPDHVTQIVMGSRQATFLRGPKIRQ